MDKNYWALTTALGALVLANILYIICVIFYDWGIQELVLFYWFEAIVVGLIGVFKIVVISLFGDPFGRYIGYENRLSALITSLVLVVIFMAKFGGFVLGAGFFIMFIPAFLDPSLVDGNDAEVFKMASSALGKIIYFIPSLAIVHLYSLLVEFFWQGEYKKMSIWGLLFSPYLKIIVLYFVMGISAVIAYALSFIGPELAFATSIISIKLLVDIYWIRKAARKSDA